MADIVFYRWVQTGMGQALADVVGFAQPPMTIEQSSKAVLERVCSSSVLITYMVPRLTHEQIDALSSETSGKFQSYDGQELPW